MVRNEGILLMAWTFSKRCNDALAAKKINVSVPKASRNRIWMALRSFDDTYVITPEYGSPTYRSLLEDLHDGLKAELGLDYLVAYPEYGDSPAEASNLEGFILRGNYPPLLLDALEIFYEILSGDRDGDFQKSINTIMEEGGLEWRMADGKIFPVNSAYIEEEISKRAYRLLHQVGFRGALHEFEKARADLANGDNSGAIQNANLAVESTIKGILGIEKARPGQLFRSIIDAGIVPQYFRGFLESFEENILRSVAIIRNEELGAGHGQGAEPNIIPRTLAELAVNLSAVIIYFLIERHLESGKTIEDSITPSSD
jgi:hypothetical protein